MMHNAWGWGTGMGFGYGGLILWILLVAAIIIGGFLLIRWILGRSGGSVTDSGGASGSDDNAIETLKKRYARGEISREEFQRIMSDIAGDQDGR